MSLLTKIAEWLEDNGGLLDYPSECVVCGFDGYESRVRKHILREHPGYIERAKELMARHRAGEIGLSEARALMLADAGKEQEA